jgi:arsenate reductase
VAIAGKATLGVTPDVGTPPRLAPAAALRERSCMSVRVYQYPKCGTCRKALKWLDAEGVDYESVHIVDRPPSRKALATLVKRSGLPLKRFFNTSGQSYRNGGFKERLPSMSDAEKLDALAADGKLLKRPIVDGEGFVLVGFKEAEYAEAFR